MSASAKCDRCWGTIDARTWDEVRALGWIQKSPKQEPTLWGWTCPACVGLPPKVPRKGKRR